MKESLFRFDEIAGGYGDTIIVSGITGAVAQASVLGIFGRNGVGKTTLSKLLVGALPLSSGSLQLHQQDLSSAGNHERRRHGVGYMPQTAMVFDNLSVRENLSLARSTQDMDYYMSAFPRLEERQN